MNIIYSISIHHRGDYLSTVITHNSLKFKTRSNLSISCGDVAYVTLTIVSEKTRDTILTILYRAPNGNVELFQNFLATFFLNRKNSNKIIHIAGDFSFNLLYYDISKKKTELFTFDVLK